MIVLALYTFLIQNPVSDEMKLLIPELGVVVVIVVVVVVTIPVTDKKFLSKCFRKQNRSLEFIYLS
jgi:hypothetical protein